MLSSLKARSAEGVPSAIAGETDAADAPQLKLERHFHWHWMGLPFKIDVVLTLS